MRDRATQIMAQARWTIARVRVDDDGQGTQGDVGASAGESIMNVILGLILGERSLWPPCR